MICITICMNKLGVFLIFVDFCIPYFEETLMWDFMGFLNFLSWVHDGFMWIFHEILHAMFESKESRFYWEIFVATEAHGETLKIIASLDSDVPESTIPVVEWYSMWFIYLFWLLSNERCIHKEYIFKWCIHWKGWFLGFYFIFCLCSPIFLNIFFHNVICLVNNDSIFTLNNVNVE